MAAIFFFPVCSILCCVDSSLSTWKVSVDSSSNHNVIAFSSPNISPVGFRLYLAGTSKSPGIVDPSLTTQKADDHRRSDNELIQAVSRTGDKTEALGGPLIYVTVLLLGTLLFFRFENHQFASTMRILTSRAIL